MGKSSQKNHIKKVKRTTHQCQSAACEQNTISEKLIRFKQKTMPRMNYEWIGKIT